MTCEQICAKYYKEHKKVYDWFNIEFDYFGRTSTPLQTKLKSEFSIRIIIIIIFYNKHNYILIKNN
jgi:methionyl-tRNA synthetase